MTDELVLVVPTADLYDEVAGRALPGWASGRPARTGLPS